MLQATTSLGSVGVIFCCVMNDALFTTAHLCLFRVFALLLIKWQYDPSCQCWKQLDYAMRMLDLVAAAAPQLCSAIMLGACIANAQSSVLMSVPVTFFVGMKDRNCGDSHVFLQSLSRLQLGRASLLAGRSAFYCIC